MYICIVYDGRRYKEMFSKKIAQIGNEVILITNKVMLRRVDARAHPLAAHKRNGDEKLCPRGL